MDEFLGKQTNIEIIKDGNTLFFTALITKITNTHISFLDMYNKHYCFKKDFINQIQEQS